MKMKSIVESWASPDFSEERVQVTLRLNSNDYVRLHALKEVYPTRSVNDMLNDIIRVGLDEIVDALPESVISRKEAQEISIEEGEPLEFLVGHRSGPGVEFRDAYERILKEKLDVESENESKIKEVT